MDFGFTVLGTNGPAALTPKDDAPFFSPRISIFSVRPRRYRRRTRMSRSIFTEHCVSRISLPSSGAPISTRRGGSGCGRLLTLVPP